MAIPFGDKIAALIKDRRSGKKSRIRVSNFYNPYRKKEEAMRSSYGIDEIARHYRELMEDLDEWIIPYC